MQCIQYIELINNININMLLVAYVMAIRLNNDVELWIYDHNSMYDNI